MVEEHFELQFPIARFATEYVFSQIWTNGEKQTVWITRHTNHGDWLPDKAWAVMIVYGSMNPHYLGEGGHWRYKQGWRYDSAETAYEALLHSIPPKQSHP